MGMQCKSCFRTPLVLQRYSRLETWRAVCARVTGVCVPVGALHSACSATLQRSADVSHSVCAY